MPRSGLLTASGHCFLLFKNIQRYVVDGIIYAHNGKVKAVCAIDLIRYAGLFIDGVLRGNIICGSTFLTAVLTAAAGH